tara:strand:- start:215 stop:985 length:771 start_codon:yes stop_codon:yes gene_type:complete
MSLKSLIQIIILLIIIVIIGGVYFNYFKGFNEISTENNDQINKIEVDESINKKNDALVKSGDENVKSEISINKKVINEEVKSEEVINEEVKNEEVKSENINLNKTTKPDKPEIDSVVKDIEYLTTDKKGNKYKILATSGRTNSEDKNVLDLDNVRGVITSKDKSKVYIVSDYAEYNSSKLQSNFYQNVIINYEDKQINCDYFDVDMKTNIAIAYNNVVVTDPQSIMKAGRIILDIETKIININPNNKENKVKVTIN